jgi:nucleotide-binding universal stress UspA family protein
MNTSIRKVISATDFSMYAHRAALRAGRLAKEHGAALDLLHVLNGPSVKALQSVLQASPPVEAVLLAEARQRLESLAEDVARAGGPTANCLVEEGEVIDVILGLAEQSDLLVLGPRGLNPAKDFLLGATAERIARRARCPLLIAKQEVAISYESVLIPVDFSDDSLWALQFARALAPRATLHVFHAYDSPFEGRLQSAGVSREAVEGYRQSVAVEAEAAMREFLARAADIKNVRSSVELGDARIALCRRATELQSNLIVMGKQGRSWLSEFLLGSVTRRTIEQAPCDVLVVPAPRSR